MSHHNKMNVNPLTDGLVELNPRWCASRGLRLRLNLRLTLKHRLGLWLRLTHMLMPPVKQHSRSVRNGSCKTTACYKVQSAFVFCRPPKIIPHCRLDVVGLV